MASSDNLRRSQSTDMSERKYHLLSRTSIRQFAESNGHSVSDDVIRVLTEDVNYRLREIVSVRDRLQFDDFALMLMVCYCLFVGSHSIPETFAQIATLCLGCATCYL